MGVTDGTATEWYIYGYIPGSRLLRISVIRHTNVSVPILSHDAYMTPLLEFWQVKTTQELVDEVLSYPHLYTACADLIALGNAGKQAYDALKNKYALLSVLEGRDDAKKILRSCSLTSDLRTAQNAQMLLWIMFKDSNADPAPDVDPVPDVDYAPVEPVTPDTTTPASSTPEKAETYTILPAEAISREWFFFIKNFPITAKHLPTQIRL